MRKKIFKIAMTTLGICVCVLLISIFENWHLLDDVLNQPAYSGSLGNLARTVLTVSGYLDWYAFLIGIISSITSWFTK